MLFVVRRLQEFRRDRKLALYICFIVPQKAYDSVDRELSWKRCSRFGAPEKMLAVIRHFHDGMRLACIQMTASTQKGLMSRRGSDKAALCRPTVSVQRALRCCDTCHSGTFQRGRRHHEGIGSLRGGCGIQKRGVISMRAKGGVGHIARR